MVGERNQQICSYSVQGSLKFMKEKVVGWVFKCCLRVIFCRLIKGITLKIRTLCFILMNSIVLNLLCVWIVGF